MKLAFFFFALLLSLEAQAFVVNTRPSMAKNAFPSVATPSTFPQSSTSLQERKYYASVDGVEGRGQIIFGVVLLFNIWMFSIPPYFRRVEFCTTPECEQNRAACNDCVTFSEWTAGISDYYKNGGGIHFDFSIDPKTKTFWSRD